MIGLRKLAQMSYDVQVCHDSASSYSKQVLLPVVPFVINHTYHTYALLDGASTNSFCTQKLAKTLNISGPKTTLRLSTLEKGDSEKESEMVSLVVSSNSATLDMSNVYVIDSIPVPKVSNTKGYKHLVGIPIPEPRKLEVDILIGQGPVSQNNLNAYGYLNLNLGVTGVSQSYLKSVSYMSVSQKNLNHLR